MDPKLVVPVVVALAGLVLNGLVMRAVARRVADYAGRSGMSVPKGFLRGLRLVIPLLLVLLIAPLLPLPEGGLLLVRRVFGVGLTLLIGWVLIHAVFVGRDVLLSRYDIDVKDNLRARAIHTQANMVVKVLVIVIGLVVGAVSLMAFDGVRQVGTSILASAGVVGIILGFAAQKSIATLLAGLQLAITQPIRIDDVVIVEGEWGRVEEITLTYVVVRIWDLRRLVVPTGYFLERPFQNWTRTSAKMLGVVTLQVDYTVPVAEVRTHLEALVAQHPLWDGTVCRLHVTQAGERSLELRALVSAADSSDAWELRCDVREGLVAYLQQAHPGALPKLRAEVESLS